MKIGSLFILRRTLTSALCCALLVGATIAARASQAEYEKQIDVKFTKALEDSLNDTRKGSDERALTLFLLNRDIEQANQLVLDYCAGEHVTKTRGGGTRVLWSSSLMWIAALDATRARLTPQALLAIEEYAWKALPNFDPSGHPDYPNMSFWEIQRGENGFMGGILPPYLMALGVVNASARYGPETDFKGKPVGQHVAEWQAFLTRYFRERAVNGSTDLEVAHPSTYAAVTMSGVYSYLALAKSDELKKLIGNFLTLYWAEAVAAFQPGTLQRGDLASTRNSNFQGARLRWERPLLYFYGWHDVDEGVPMGFLVHVLSGYHPPEILRSIARDPERNAYLATSRRMGMLGKEVPGNDGIVGLDENGNSFIRRDVWYTRDYVLSTIAYDPAKNYRNEIVLYQIMGVKFASDPQARIAVLGLGYYGARAINGITGNAVSIIARDPNATYGNKRFQSLGTRVFIRKGELWDNRVEDPSGWFFTRAGDAFAAIRVSGGYTVTDKPMQTNHRGENEFAETPDPSGSYLIFDDMWSPVVLQMGQAKDYKSFEAFQASVKENPFTYADGKLAYTSEAGDTYEAWAKFPQLPKINGETLNLNPEYVYKSPYLKMKHGSNRAVISHPGYQDLVLEFSK